MGYIICILIISFVLFLVGIICLDKGDRPLLACLAFFLIPIACILSNCYDESDYESFNLKYSYVINNNFYTISLDDKIKYVEYVKYINDEIDYAEKNCFSIWNGIFTDKRLLSYKKIGL